MSDNSEIENQKTENQKRNIDILVIEEICGSMKGSLSSSEDFAKQKQFEIELETQKIERFNNYCKNDK